MLQYWLHSIYELYEYRINYMVVLVLYVLYDIYDTYRYIVVLLYYTLYMWGSATLRVRGSTSASTSTIVLLYYVHTIYRIYNFLYECTIYQYILQYILYRIYRSTIPVLYIHTTLIPYIIMSKSIL